MNRPRFSAIFSILVLAAGSLAVCMYFGRGVSLADQETKLRRSILAEPGNSTASMELARILSQKQAWPESVVTLQEALKHAPGDLDLNRQLAVVYGDWFDGTQDLKKLSKAVKHLEQVVDSGKAAATDYEMLAARQFSAGNHIRAAEAYAEAAKRAPQDLRLLEHVHYAGYMAGQYEKSLAFFKNLTENAPKNDWAWQMRGIIEYHVGKYDDAVSSLEKSLALATAANRKSAQENLEYALRLQSKERTKSNFYAHYGMATTHFKKSRADRAAAEYEAAVSISTEYKKQAAWAYAWMADFATYMSNDDQALEYAQRAVELARQINDPNDLSFKYQQLASIYTQKAIREKDKFNDYMEKSIEAHEQQLEYCRRARNRHMEIHALADLALTLVKRDGVEGEKAKCYRAEMAAFLPKAGQPIDCATASVLAAEGWFCKYEQDYAGAEESLKPAAEYYAQSTDARDAKHGPYLYAELAALAYRRNDYDLGIQYGERAAELLSRLRSLLGADEFRQKVGGETWRDTFKVLIKCAFEKRDTRAVFNYCEQYKAQALLELLGSRAETKRGRERLLVAKNEAIAPAKFDEAEDEEALSGLRDLSIEQSHYPRLPEDTASGRRTIQSFERAVSCGAEEIQKIAGNFTFVSYGISDEGTVAAVLTQDGIEAVELAANATQLQEAIEAFRDGLGLRQGIQRDLNIESDGVPASDSGDRAKALKEASENLWDLLIEPVKPHLRTELLYICPDGILNYLPFEALGKSGRYLVQDFAVAYAPSATVLKYCMDKERTQKDSVLALGNPNLQNPAFRLINAEDEVHSLKEFFASADILIGDDANERLVLERSPTYNVLHFACHGELNLDEPMLTALRLSPDEQNDGYLHAGEIFDLDLKASLVVLSACNTGLGELHTGNELAGLTRSFLYAGASSIVASLWTVDDRSTAKLMRAFYRNLGVMNKAEALRQAKLETLEEYPNPFHWAAFCLQGDYR